VQVRVNGGLLDCWWEVQILHLRDWKASSNRHSAQPSSEHGNLVCSLHPCVSNDSQYNKINSINSINRLDFDRNPVFSVRRAQHFGTVFTVI